MNITFVHAGQTYRNWTIADALSEAVAPTTTIGAAAKEAGRVLVRNLSDRFRNRLSSASPGKLAEFRVKEEIATDPVNADPAELALITREATARGMTQAEFITLILARTATFRQTALLVAAIEAEAIAAVDALLEDQADIEAAILAELQSAQQAADTAFNAALTALSTET